MKAQFNLYPLQEFIQSTIEPKEVAEFLNEMIIHYARLSLSTDRDIICPHPDVDTHIFYTKELADIFKKIGQQIESE